MRAEEVREADEGCARGPSADCVSTPAEPHALAEPGLRAVEQRMYRALVERTYAVAEGDGDGWGSAVPELVASWAALTEKYRYGERGEPVSAPEPRAEGGAWRGHGGRALDAARNAEVDAGYARIREVGEGVITPAMLRVEAEDQSRGLAGLDCRIKGVDRLKEKVADLLEPPSKLAASEAISAIVDVVRFSFAYPESRYAEGVQADAERLTGQGFELDRLKNTWHSAQYKGINSQWLEPGSGVRFEVQFHTQASLEAKELTHGAYERIRSITEATPESDQETAELEAFQSAVNANVPIPPGVSAIKDYRRERHDG